MGEKGGKKNKEKGQKQNAEKKKQKSKNKLDKQPTRKPLYKSRYEDLHNSFSHVKCKDYGNGKTWGLSSIFKRVTRYPCIEHDILFVQGCGSWGP